jgi:serine/threonine-protein kinase HipA
MAPTYDIVTTTAYIKNDVPALTLAGTKKWWPRKFLEQFAGTHLSLTSREIRDIFEQTTTAVAETRRDIAVYVADHPDFKEVGTAMQASWETGLNNVF